MSVSKNNDASIRADSVNEDSQEYPCSKVGHTKSKRGPDANPLPEQLYIAALIFFEMYTLNNKLCIKIIKLKT